jgi:hypothetical protein
MNSSKAAFAATVVVFLLAIAAAVFAFWKISEETFPDDSDRRTPQNSAFVPSDDLRDEMQNAAERLIKNNHTLITLYITRGLPHREEPYGNRPENDIYYVDSPDYQVLDDIESIVRDTFIPEEAERVINNRTDSGRRYYNHHLPEHLDRIYFNKESHDGARLGIHMDFEPFPDYPINWEGVSYIISPVTASEVELSVKLTVNGVEAVFERVIYKLNGEWFLNQFIHYESE